MSSCQNCRGQAHNGFLCSDCVDTLDDLLSQLPWLLVQLEVTRCRQDRLTVGSTRRSAETLSPINVGCMELARETASTLIGWKDALGSFRLDRLVRHPRVGDFYRDICDLAGDPDHPESQPGKILTAINRSERIFGGLCPTITGYDRDGLPIECGASLYGTADQQTTTCSRCKYEIDIQRNRSRCAVDRDLATEARLLSLLDDLDEAVPRVTFYKWLKEGKLAVRGWMHMGQVVPHRIRRGDPRVFSISQARSLRAQELAVA